MKIIEATDAMEITRCRSLLYGQPGIGKSSLGFSADEPLTLDFDGGSYRAKNRKRLVSIESWDDVPDLLDNKRDFLTKHKTMVLDTVGRCLDMMTLSIISENGKLGYNGNLNIQGWGALKTRFRTFMANLDSLGMDVVMIAHSSEERGDNKSYRPDIQGGSLGEVLKVADFIGFYSMQGKDRVLDFSPTESWIGKNPANWAPFKVPSLEKSPLFLGNLLREGRAALGKLSEDSADIAKQIADWGARMEEYSNSDEINAAIPTIMALSPVILLEQVKRALGKRAKALGLAPDKATGKFVAATA